MTTNDDIEGWGLKTIYSMVTIAKTQMFIVYNQKATGQAQKLYQMLERFLLFLQSIISPPYL